jgi:hypothetical protein
MEFRGSCHCGRVAFSFAGELTGAMACNCSICARKGAPLWFVPRAALRLETADAELATYTFGCHAIRHRFCPTCGIHTFVEGTDPQGNPMAGINIRCLDGVDADRVPLRHFDGRSL